LESIPHPGGQPANAEGEVNTEQSSNTMVTAAMAPREAHAGKQKIDEWFISKNPLIKKTYTNAVSGGSFEPQTPHHFTPW
jgi:hypothetical protein